MTYSTTQGEARFCIQSGQQGDIITKWFREVTEDQNGDPHISMFKAYCEADTGQPRCDLVWTSEVSQDGKLIQNYTCAPASCQNGCVLQFSLDDKTWTDVTEQDQPSPTKDCYFRCRCDGGTS